MDRKDPFNSFNFLVELDGTSYGIFTEVSGLDSSIEVVEYREGGETTTVRKLPGKTTYSNISLKTGTTDDLTLYNWHKQAVQGRIQRRDGSIVALNHVGEEVARWNFFNAWPTKYEAPSFNATGNEIAIETMELAHEKVERV